MSVDFSEETITHLDINLGDQCNLKCRMCECWLNKDPLQLEAEELWPQVEKALTYVEEHCPNFEKAMIIGGEPFTHPGLVDFLLEQELDIFLSVYTNFSIELPDVDWPSNVHFLTSLDAACEETYMKIRRTDDWETTQKNMRRHADNLLHVDTTVTQLNVNEMDEILALTEEFDCGHWFLPGDPRIVDYSKQHPENELASSTAQSMVPHLLDEDSIGDIKKFYDEHGHIERTNNLEMFLTLYYQGVDIYGHLPEYDLEIPDGIELQQPSGACPAGERYLEIGFDDDGNFVPILHCPEIREGFEIDPNPGTERRASSFQPYQGDPTPHFREFDELMDWMGEQFSGVDCAQHCGKTQFLGLSDFNTMLQEDAAVSDD